MIAQGIYRHYKGGLYSVLFVARDSTNGPNEGKNVVVYMDHKHGYVHVRDEEQFKELVEVGPEQGYLVGSAVPRFSFAFAQLSDKQAEEAYDDLLELTGRNKK